MTRIDMDRFVRLLESAGVVADPGALERWAIATRSIGVPFGLLSEAWRLGQDGATLDHLQPNAIRHRRDADGEAAWLELSRMELALVRLERLDDDGLLGCVAGDTFTMRAVLETMRDEPRSPLAQRLRVLLALPSALARRTPKHLTVEHERRDGDAYPLLDHLTDRCLGEKMAGLEADRIEVFQREDALSRERFAITVSAIDRLRAAGLLPVLRIALAFLDFAKGGDPSERERWEALGADLSIHNLAARRIVETSGALRRFPILRTPVLERLALIAIETHGLAGQAVRGETPLILFAPFVAFLRTEARALADHLATTVESAQALAGDLMHVVDVADTAAVREGLMTDGLHRELVEVEDEVLDAARRSGEPAEDLAAVERERWERRLPGRTDLDRARLADRIARLRAGRIRRGEPVEETERMVASLSPATIDHLSRLFARCQLWYAEAGTGSLSPEAQLTILATGMKVAEDEASVDTTRPFHVSLLPLVSRIGEMADRAVDYRRRLMEAALARISIDDLVAGRTAPPKDAVMALVTQIGRASAIAIDSEESDEAKALLTLLPIYERKSSAAFHATLKALCDLYGLRKDELDRVANEELYLAHMNSARSDKERMLDYVRPGRVVEIGPGGGVVLDLLEARFPGSEILGIDVSRMVVDALSARKKKEARRWAIIEADAYRLGEIVGEGSVDTVVFCSILHEIYSYVEHVPDGGGPARRFTLEAVREILRAAFSALRPKGRIVIRDGVTPPGGVRILRFVAPDAKGFFDLFVDQFEGRKIQFERIGDDRVRLSAPDAMEFLYTYTWGPQSFPYEVREQYGVLPYDVYVEAILGWLGPSSKVVPLPTSIRSYLQKGYEEGLRGKIELSDERGPVKLPDSNCLIVIEKEDGLR
jgi:SAM-dependent methyltransferase